MVQMTRDDYELFTMIATVPQKKLQKILYKILRRNYKNIINTPDYLVAQGDIPLGLVAHMDTVFKLPPLEKEIYFDRAKGVMWSPSGLGADDRAGVFLILKLIQSVKKGHKPTVIFTQDEEKGCLGASQLVTDYKDPPWPMKYLIQLDRRGQIDCVFYDEGNVEFIHYVEEFGFKEEIGSFSDISIICPSWGISGVNLSVGYEDEHMEIETLHIKYLYETLQKVKQMIKEIDNAEFFKYEGIINPFRYGLYPGYFYDEDEDEYDYRWSNHTTSCHKCGKAITKSVSIRAKNDLGNFHYYCPDCASKMVEWCSNCGTAFIMSYPQQTLCCDCAEKLWEMK